MFECSCINRNNNNVTHPTSIVLFIPQCAGWRSAPAKYKNSFIRPQTTLCIPSLPPRRCWTYCKYTATYWHSSHVMHHWIYNAFSFSSHFHYLANEVVIWPRKKGCFYGCEVESTLLGTGVASGSWKRLWKNPPQLWSTRSYLRPTASLKYWCES